MSTFMPCLAGTAADPIGHSAVFVRFVTGSARLRVSGDGKWRIPGDWYRKMSPGAVADRLKSGAGVTASLADGGVLVP